MNILTFEISEDTKVFSIHRMADEEEVGEKYITPCYVERVFASDGILDLDIEKNLISQELGDQLGLSYEILENGEKKVNKKLLMNLVGETNDESIEKTKG